MDKLKLEIHPIGAGDLGGLSPHLIDGWNKLWSSSKEPFASTHPNWALCHTKYLTEKTKNPSLLALYIEDELLLLGAMLVGKESLEFINKKDVTDYNDFCYERGQHEKAIFGFLSEAKKIGIKQVVLNGIASDSNTLEALEKSSELLGWSFVSKVEDVSPSIKLPPSWEEYLQMLSKKNRHEVRRKLKRAEENHELHKEIFLTKERIEKEFERFLELLISSSEEKREFLTKSRALFMKELTKEMAKLKFSRLCITKVNGVDASASLSFECHGVEYLYNSGISEGMRSLSAGIVNHITDIKDATMRGITRYDFMRGSEPYKYRLGGETSERKILETTLTA